MLLHLPVKEELVPGASGAVAGIQESLDSLKQGVGEDISAVGALFKIDPDTVGRKYARYPHDAHPSAWAQKLFAAGLTQMITSTPLAASFKKRSQA